HREHLRLERHDVAVPALLEVVDAVPGDAGVVEGVLLGLPVAEQGGDDADPAVAELAGFDPRVEERAAAVGDGVAGEQKDRQSGRPPSGSHSHSLPFQHRMMRAGLPATTQKSGTERVTTAPAPTTLFSPMRRSPHTTAPMPSQAPRAI